MIHVEPTGGVCGAFVTGADLRETLAPAEVATLRKAWNRHKLLIFRDQQLTPAEQERATKNFGPVGDDPYFVPIDNDTRVVAICRRADEKAPLFAETWHTDWSFKAVPPAGTLLYGVTIPPVGGNTSFVDQEAVLKEMPADLRARLDGRMARHSAAVAYAPDGSYGKGEAEADRSMKIRVDESAREEHSHPLIIKHPETGRAMVYGTYGYIFAIEGMADDEARALLLELYEWQSQPQFQYHHQWQPGTLVLWDNRALLHKANGGFDGHDRLLHRTTVADDPAFYVT